MTVLPDEVDPFISERIVAIRNRFGVEGLRTAARVSELELTIFGDVPRALAEE